MNYKEQSNQKPPLTLVDTSGSYQPTLGTNVLELNPENFSQAIQQRMENRDLLLSTIQDRLVRGTDFTIIKIGGRDSKPFLTKAGAEKICGMLALTVHYPNLERYEEMMFEGKDIKNIIIKCQLISPNGNVVADGIGCRSAMQDFSKSNGQSFWDINKAFKMALKSAHIDATLRAGGLSEIFTQDPESVEGNEVQKATRSTEKKSKVKATAPVIAPVVAPVIAPVVATPVPSVATPVIAPVVATPVPSVATPVIAPVVAPVVATPVPSVATPVPSVATPVPSVATPVIAPVASTPQLFDDDVSKSVEKPNELVESVHRADNLKIEFGKSRYQNIVSNYLKSQKWTLFDIPKEHFLNVINMLRTGKIPNLIVSREVAYEIMDRVNYLDDEDKHALAGWIKRNGCLNFYELTTVLADKLNKRLDAKEELAHG